MNPILHVEGSRRGPALDKLKATGTANSTKRDETAGGNFVHIFINSQKNRSGRTMIQGKSWKTRERASAGKERSQWEQKTAANRKRKHAESTDMVAGIQCSEERTGSK